MASIKELKEQKRASLERASQICDAVDREGRDFTQEERDEVSRLGKAARDAKQAIQKLEGDESLRRQLEDLAEAVERETPKGSKARGKGSIGEQFVSNPEFRAWYQAMAPSGVISETRKGIVSPPVEYKTFGLFRKDLVTGSDDTSAGAFVDVDRTGIYEPLGRYPLNIRDLISVRSTSSDTVEFVRQVTQSNAAAPVPEANVTTYTGYPGEVSGVKPETSISFERVTETVKTLAVWIPATKRALSDAAQIRGLIDQELREDLAEELENQILNGDGTGENFTGVANTANVLVQAFDTDLFTTTRKAITKLRLYGKQQPTAFVMHPSDAEMIDLLKDGENRYYYGGPQAIAPRTLGGVPVVESYFQTEGVAYLANWRKAVLWDREAANISVSDSHNDFFIRNMVAILAEMRAAFGIIRPSAFVEVDLSGGS